MPCRKETKSLSVCPRLVNVRDHNARARPRQARFTTGTLLGNPLATVAGRQDAGDSGLAGHVQK